MLNHLGRMLFETR